jgi:pyridoxal phosphate enzyme (YggS family)
MTKIEARRAELAVDLAALRGRVNGACSAAGRSPSEVRLVAVTKFFPVSDVHLLSEMGVADFGESRDQEAAAKILEFGALTPAAARWHFIGRLQSNKVKSIARYADSVDSLDRMELISPLVDALQRAERPRLDVLVQFSLDVDPRRGGVASDDLLRLADRVAEQESLQLAGVMAMRPIGADQDTAFELLGQIATTLRRFHPDATAISAGTSDDFEAAIRHGATQVRIGSALLGRRPTTFR